MLVVPIGFLIGPAARWMYFSLVVEPSYRLGVDR